MCELDGPGTCLPTPDFQRIDEDAQSCRTCWGIIPDGAHLVPEDGTVCDCPTPSRILPVDAFIDALWAALAAHGTSSADGVTVLVEQTGGGNEALVIRSGAYVVVVTDGDLGVLLGTSMDDAVEYTGDAWDDGGDYTAILDDASPLAVAAHVAIYCNPTA